MSDDVVREFLVESTENLDLLDRELMNLEKDPENRPTLASVFRTIHTIKGACGFLGFTKLESVAHVGESLLSRLRDGEIRLNPEITNALLQMVDAIREMLANIDTAGDEGQRDDSELIGSLTRLQSGSARTGFEGTPNNAATAESALAAASTVKAPKDSAGASPEATTNLHEAAKSEDTRLPDGRVGQDASGVADVAASPQGPGPSRGGANESSVRVDVVLLDKLMNLVGELVLARNQILQFSNATDDTGIGAPSQQLNLITAELQEGVMKTRMQPIGNIWSKYPRIVRDLATACGKQVRIEMEGKETDLDRTIIEAIKDPLTHIVRNSVDHGIELAEKRIAAGKPPQGKLLLRAYHEGGQVVIEISDDGAGLNSEKLLKKALSKGLITQEQANRLDDRETWNLIFLPGFSTAETVTSVSGRGVGMDVVKTNIEKIGGVVDILSTPGSGTTIRMKIPLTLAIVPGLVVLTAGNRFVIPQASLLELVRIEAGHGRNGIEMVHGLPVYRLRGRLLPLAYLDTELQLRRQSERKDDENSPANVVVLQAENHRFGLVVDEIKDTEEIVVKSFGRRLKGIKTFAGATIMGDGRVALILDVLGLAQRSGIVSKQQERPLTALDPVASATSGEKQAFLIFAGPNNARMALPLGTLARLEEFSASSVEKSGDEWLIQYRGSLLPLIRLSVVLEERRKSERSVRSAVPPSEGVIQVLVCNHEGRTFGLVAEKIVDIVEDQADIKSPATRGGIACTAVIENRVTEMLDLPAILHVVDTAHALRLEHVAAPH